MPIENTHESIRYVFQHANWLVEVTSQPEQMWIMPPAASSAREKVIFICRYRGSALSATMNQWNHIDWLAATITTYKEQRVRSLHSYSVQFSQCLQYVHNTENLEYFIFRISFKWCFVREKLILFEFDENGDFFAFVSFAFFFCFSLSKFRTGSNDGTHNTQTRSMRSTHT